MLYIVGGPKGWGPEGTTPRSSLMGLKICRAHALCKQHRCHKLMPWPSLSRSGAALRHTAVATAGQLAPPYRRFVTWSHCCCEIKQGLRRSKNTAPLHFALVLRASGPPYCRLLKFKTFGTKNLEIKANTLKDEPRSQYEQTITFGQFHFIRIFDSQNTSDIRTHYVNKNKP